MNIISKLENLFEKYKIENNINEIIIGDKNLFNYKKITDITYIKSFYKRIKEIYYKSLKTICNIATFINSIELRMIGKKYKSIDLEIKNICDDLLLEIESIISYIKIFFKPKTKLWVQADFEYHSRKSLLLYLFSSFDKIACLLYYQFNIDKFDSDENFEKSFAKNITKIKFKNVDSYFINTHPCEEKIKNKFKIIVNSPIFEYAKNSRNVSSHQFLNPLLKYYFDIDIMITFILLIEVLVVISENKNNIIKISNF